VIFQGSLFRRNTADRALELASWLRIETKELRDQVKAIHTSLKKQEAAMHKLEGMISDLRQKELFEERP
jgi:phage shock protein A